MGMYFAGYNDAVFTYQVVESAADHNTSSTSYEVMDSMTLSPASGTYMVWFNTTVVNTTGNADTYISLFAGGVQVATSERLIEEDNGTNQSIMSTMGVITVDGTQAIDLRWKVSTGTSTAHAKTLMILKVG